MRRRGCGNVKQMSESAPAEREPRDVSARGAGSPRSGASRLAWLDALRGFAALCVVFDHASSILLLPARSFLYQWFNLGQYGVFVFFLVSGYIVPASLERKGSIRGFWISRAFRLYPMFLLGLVLSVVLYQTGHGTIENAGAHPLAAVLGWLFMLQNLVAGLNLPDVAWTLSYEMLFYLLLTALFAWGIHRRSGWYASGFAVAAVAFGGVFPMAAIGVWAHSSGHKAVTINAVVDALILVGLALAVLSRSRSWPAKAGTTLAALVVLVLVTINQNYPYRWSGCMILALMFTGTLIYRAEQKQVSRVVAAVIAVGVLALLTYAGIWHGARYGHHWQVQWTTSVLAAGATFGIGLAMRNLRIPRWCAWLGMISYSVYLLHPLVLNAYRTVPALHRKHTMPDQVLFFAGLFAVIVGLSALTYYFVEKPMQRLGRRVATRFAYPQIAATSAGTASEPGGAPAAAARSASSSTAVAGGSGGSP
jgi:peptidoglycan/LPS O-acetylase OafA/YrhL